MELMETLAAKQRSNQDLQVEVFVDVKTNKVGLTSSRSSATTRMHVERHSVIRQEESASGQPAAWPNTIQSIRCVDAACPRQGQHFQVIPTTGKHSPLISGDIHKLTKRDTSFQQGPLSARAHSVRAVDSSHKRRKLDIAGRSPASFHGITPSPRSFAAQKCYVGVVPKSVHISRVARRWFTLATCARR